MQDTSSDIRSRLEALRERNPGIDQPPSRADLKARADRLRETLSGRGVDVPEIHMGTMTQRIGAKVARLGSATAEGLAKGASDLAGGVVWGANAAVRPFSEAVETSIIERSAEAYADLRNRQIGGEELSERDIARMNLARDEMRRSTERLREMDVRQAQALESAKDRADWLDKRFALSDEILALAPEASIVEEVVGSLANMAAPIAATAITRNPGAGYAMFAAQGAGRGGVEALSAGADMGTANRAAALHGALALTEMAPIGRGLARLGRMGGAIGKSKLKERIAFTLTQGLEETVQEGLIQTPLEKVIAQHILEYADKQDFADYLKDSLHAGKIGFLAGVVMAGGGVAVQSASDSLRLRQDEKASGRILAAAEPGVSPARALFAEADRLADAGAPQKEIDRVLREAYRSVDADGMMLREGQLQTLRDLAVEARDEAAIERIGAEFEVAAPIVLQRGREMAKQSAAQAMEGMEGQAGRNEVADTAESAQERLREQNMKALEQQLGAVEEATEARVQEALESEDVASVEEIKAAGAERSKSIAAQIEATKAGVYRELGSAASEDVSPAEAEVIGLLEEIASYGGSIPTVSVFETDTAVPMQGMYRGGQLVVNVARDGSSSSGAQGIVLHEMLHHGLAVGSKGYKALVERLRTEAPLMVTALADAYVANYVNQTGEVPSARLQQSNPEAWQAEMVEEALANAAELMPNLIRTTMADPAWLQKAGEQGWLAKIVDWLKSLVFAEIGQTQDTGRAKKLRKAMDGLVAAELDGYGTPEEIAAVAQALGDAFREMGEVAIREQVQAQEAAVQEAAAPAAPASAEDQALADSVDVAALEAEVAAEAPVRSSRARKPAEAQPAEAEPQAQKAVAEAVTVAEMPRTAPDMFGETEEKVGTRPEVVEDEQAQGAMFQEDTGARGQTSILDTQEESKPLSATEKRQARSAAARKRLEQAKRDIRASGTSTFRHYLRAIGGLNPAGGELANYRVKEDRLANHGLPPGFAPLVRAEGKGNAPDMALRIAIEDGWFLGGTPEMIEENLYEDSANPIDHLLELIESNPTRDDINGVQPDPFDESPFSVAPPTYSPAFRRWFGDSKVVDAEGKPLVVYHGTEASIDAFRIPAFFAEDQLGLEFFGGRLYRVYLSIQNPFDARGRDGALALIDLARRAGVKVDVRHLADGGWDFETSAIAEHSPYEGQNLNDLVYVPSVREQMEREGYDGMQADDVLGNSEIPIWVAFRPEQIKSATGNSGAFDPANPDIRFSVAPAWDTPEWKAMVGETHAEFKTDAGLPRVFYSGTNDTFTKIDLDESMGDYGVPAFYLSSDAAVAGEYVNRSDRATRAAQRAVDAATQAFVDAFAPMRFGIPDNFWGRGPYWYNQAQRHIEYDVEDGEITQEQGAAAQDALAAVDNAIYALAREQERLRDYPSGGNVIPAYIWMKRPLVVDASGLQDWTLVMPGSVAKAKSEGYDGLIVKNVIDTADGAPEPSDVVVAFEPNQVKSIWNRRPTSSPDIRYSVAGDLVALHNLSEENILHAAEIGGLAMPSLMVRKVEHGPATGFGDITLIAGPDAVDPEKGVPVFESDAWTPRHPRMEYRKSQKAAQAIVNELKPHLEGAGMSTWEAHDNLLSENIGWSKNRDEARSYMLGRNSRWPLVYALQQGKHVRRYKKKSRVSLLGSESRAFAAWAKAWIADEGGYQVVTGGKWHKALTKALALGIEEKYGGSENAAAIRAIFKDQLNSDGLVRVGMNEHAALKQLREPSAVDYRRMATVARKKINAQEFEAWVDKQLDRVWTSPYIQVGRRKVPYSLDAVMESMAAQSPQAKEESMTFGAGKVRATVSRKFWSLDDIRDSAERLVDDFAAYEKEVQKPLQEAYHASVIESYKWGGSFDAYDDSMKALAKAMKRGAPTSAKVRAALQSLDFVNPSPEAVEAGVKLAEAIRLAPSEYFEAKYPGAMRLDAFRGALVPSGNKRAISVLEEAGVPVTTYTRSQDKAKRLASAIRKSKKVTGEDPRWSVASFEDGDIPLANLGAGAMSKGQAAWQKYATSRGNLPQSVFDAMIRRDGKVAVANQKIRTSSRHLRTALRKMYGVKTVAAGEVPPGTWDKIDRAFKDHRLISGLPEPLRGPVREMRNHVDELSMLLVQSGAVEGRLQGSVKGEPESQATRAARKQREKLAEKIVEGIGFYATRSFQAFDDPDWSKKVDPAVRNRLVSILREEYAPVQVPLALKDPKTPGRRRELQALAKHHHIPANLKSEEIIERLEAPRLTDSQIEAKLDKVLFDAKQSQSPVAYLASGKLGSKDLSIFTKRKDLSPEFRAFLGEYTDPMVNYARSVTKMAFLIANQQFLSEARAAGLDEGFFIDGGKPDGDKIAEFASDESDVLSPLNGIYTTPDVHQAFVDATRRQVLPSYLQAYMKVNGTVKMMKTVGSAQTHVRNVVGNIGFAVAQGHWQVRSFGDAFAGIAAGYGVIDSARWEAYFEEALRLGVVHESARAGELNDTVQDAIGMSQDDFLAVQAKRRMRSALIRASRGMTTVYQAEDDVWKLYAWENERSRYAEAYPEWSAEEVAAHAAKIVRNTYPTYSLVSAGVKFMRMLPTNGTFVSFPAEVVRVTWNTAHLIRSELADPKTRKIGAQRLAGSMLAASIPAAISFATAMYFGYDREDREAMRKFAPPWSQNGDFVYLGPDENGKPRYIDLGYTDPHSYLRAPLYALIRGDDLADGISTAASEVAEPFVGTEILADAIIELASNKTATGGEVYDEGAELWTRGSQVAEHFWRKAFRPGTLASLERIQKGIDGEVETWGKGYNTADEVLAVVSGQRRATIDVEQSLVFLALDYSEANRRATKVLTSVASRQGNVEEDEIREAYERMEVRRRKAHSDLVDAVRAARRLGTSDEVIEARLKAASVSKDSIRSAMNDEYEPYRATSSFLKFYERGSDDARISTLRERRRLVQSIGAGR